MRKLKTWIFEENGRWFFRWDNIDVPTACYVSPPLASEQVAESMKQAFMETERKKEWLGSV